MRPLNGYRWNTVAAKLTSTVLEGTGSPSFAANSSPHACNNTIKMEILRFFRILDHTEHSISAFNDSDHTGAK